MRNLVKDAISYYDMNTERVQKVFKGESLTHTDQAAATDINNIVRDYHINGTIAVGAKKPPTFGDFSEVHSYEAALTFIRDAEMAFMDLPASERKEFDNDAAKWVEYHTKNAEEAAKATEAAKAEADTKAKEQVALQEAQELIDKHKS